MTRKLRLAPIRGLRGMNLEARVWIRGYKLAEKRGYGYEDDGVDSPERDEAISQSIRDCRIFAMAYSMGWLNRHKNGEKRKQHRFTMHGGIACVDCGIHRDSAHEVCFPLPGHEPPPDANNFRGKRGKV